MSILKKIHGGGTGPVNDEEDKDKDKTGPKYGKDPILEIAEFFDRLDSHRPRKPRVKTSFSRR